MTQQSARRTDQPDIGGVLLWAVRIGVLLVLATPLIVRTDVYFPFVVGKAVYARTVIEITLTAWVALVLFYPQHRPPRSWVILMFAVWVAASWIAGLLGVSPTRSMWSSYERMQGVFDLAHWFAFVIIAASVFRSLRDWRLVFSVNLGLSTLVCVLGLGQHLGVWNSELLGDSNRISSTLGNATYVGAYALINALIGLGLVIQSIGRSSQRQGVGESGGRSVRRRRRRGASQGSGVDFIPLFRVLWVAAILVNLWALWLSGTRGAVVGFSAALLVFSVAYAIWGGIPAARKASIGLILLVTIGLGVLVLARATTVLDPIKDSSLMLSRVSAISLDDRSIRGRVVSAEAGMRAFLDRPLFGWGPENYLSAWGRYFDLDSGITERFDQAHSKLVEELTTKGLIGLLSYLAIWGSMAYAVLRSLRRRSGYDQLFVGVIGAALIAYFVQNLFLFDTPATVMQFALLVSFVVAEEGWVRTQDYQIRSQESSFMSGRLLWPLAQLSRLLTSNVGAGAVVIVVTALAITSLTLFNARSYSAAAATVVAIRETASWSDRIENYRLSIDEFPGLANYPRLLLASDAIDRMLKMTDEEFQLTVDLVAAQVAVGLEAEPQNWRLEATTAAFYQVAARRDRSYLEAARQHVDRSVELAPRTREVATVLEQQVHLEELLGQQ